MVYGGELKKSPERLGRLSAEGKRAEDGSSGAGRVLNVVGVLLMEPVGRSGAMRVLAISNLSIASLISLIDSVGVRQ